MLAENRNIGATAFLKHGESNKVYGTQHFAQKPVVAKTTTTVQKKKSKKGELLNNLFELILKSNIF